MIEINRKPIKKNGDIKLFNKTQIITATGKIIPPPLKVLTICELLWLRLSTILNLFANLKYIKIENINKIIRKK